MQEQIAILAQGIPFLEVSRLSKSESSGVAALGLSALARRDDLPAEWTTKAISLLAAAPPSRAVHLPARCSERSAQ